MPQWSTDPWDTLCQHAHGLGYAAACSCWVLPWMEAQWSHQPGGWRTSLLPSVPSNSHWCFWFVIYYFTGYTLHSHHTESHHNDIIFQLPDELANIPLARIGFLGCSPTIPSVAFSFKCLELYHQLRCCQSSFGVQAYAKVLCALHNVSLYANCIMLLIVWVERLHICGRFENNSWMLLTLI